MKRKNYLFIGIAVLILAVIIIAVSLTQKSPARDNFLYETGEIPLDKLISDDNGNVNTSEIRGGPCTGCESSPVYVCKDTDKILEKIEISRPLEGNKGGETRYALVCGDNYYILRIFGSVLKVYGPFEKDLKSECCAECIEGFRPQWAASLYCVDKSKMSPECIDYLGIKDSQGISTAEAYSNKCK